MCDCHSWPACVAWRPKQGPSRHPGPGLTFRGPLSFPSQSKLTVVATVLRRRASDTVGYSRHSRDEAAALRCSRPCGARGHCELQRLCSRTTSCCCVHVYVCSDSGERRACRVRGRRGAFGSCWCTRLKSVMARHESVWGVPQARSSGEYIGCVYPATCSATHQPVASVQSARDCHRQLATPRHTARAAASTLMWAGRLPMALIAHSSRSWGWEVAMRRRLCHSDAIATRASAPASRLRWREPPGVRNEAAVACCTAAARSSD